MIKRFGERARQLFVKYNKPPSIIPECGVWADLFRDPNMDFFYGAPLLVLVFSSWDGHTPARDCSLAAENMMLAASSLGVGSCWVGTGQTLSMDRDVLDEIAAPADHNLVAPLIFGYPAEKNLRAPARNCKVILNWID